MQRFLILFLLTTACLGAQGQQLAPNDYIYPLRELKQRLYSANFGEIRPGHFHAGVDIKTDAEEGKPVVAAADGYVSRVVLQAGGYGRAVYLTLRNGTTVVYGHLRRFRDDMERHGRREGYERRSNGVNLWFGPGTWPVKQGDVIVSGEKADIKPGNALPMARIPVGTVLHNIELNPGRGGQFCRAAGTYAQLVAKEGKYALLRMPSGEVRKVLATCLATIGQVGNIQHENISLGKAGRNRWLGRRPKVRGVAMNPVDHPLGGGEGRSSGGRHPVSPWGMPTKGYKTRDKKKPSSRLIVKRRGQK